MTFKLTNGHTATIHFNWGNGVVQFSYVNSAGQIIIVRAKRADWEA
jgi:hypothetical protein